MQVTKSMIHTNTDQVVYVTIVRLLHNYFTDFVYINIMGDSEILKKLEEIINGQNALKRELNENLESFKSSIKEEISLFKVQIGTKINEVETRLQAVEISQDFISGKYDSMQEISEENSAKQDMLEKDTIQTRNIIRQDIRP